MEAKMKSNAKAKAKTRRKRRMPPIRVDYMREEIITTTKFYNKAQDPRSSEYVQLQKIKAANPNCKVVRHTIAKSESKESYKGLTYAYMRRYMNNNLTGKMLEKAIADFERQLEYSECHSNKYPKIKKWFLETFPEVKTEYGKGSVIEEETKHFDLEPIDGSLAA